MFTDPNRPKPPTWRIIFYTVLALMVFVLLGYFGTRI